MLTKAFGIGPADHLSSCTTDTLRLLLCLSDNILDNISTIFLYY